MNVKEQLVILPLNGYAPLVGYALASLEWERSKTLETVSGLSTKQLDTQVESVANSIGSLLYHVAAIELDWLYCEILEQPVPPDFTAFFPLDVRDPYGNLSRVLGMELSAHLDRLASVRNMLFDELRSMTDENFYRFRHLEPYDVNPAWVLYHLLEHEAKHGDQMAHVRRALS